MEASQALQGHRALVTGAAVRLGRAFALALARSGAAVAIHYGHSTDEARQTARQIEEAGGAASILQADLSNPHEAAELIGRAVAALGEVDLLVNSASIFESQRALDTSLDAWNANLAINLTAPFLLSQAFARHRQDRDGTIVNILDWRALRPGPDHFAYTITKAALAAMTHSLALAFAPNIRVNGLALGAILPSAGGAADEGHILAKVPLGRWARLEEVENALLFLLGGPEYITGTILHVDGGRRLA